MEEKAVAKYLVIVESPAKAKTINKFLGSNYHVVASNGHVRDLPKSRLGIDVEDDYEPKYITIRGKGDILAMLRKEAKKADKIYLATDPDREGEAISWHLATALKLDEASEADTHAKFHGEGTDVGARHHGTVFGLGFLRGHQIGAGDGTFGTALVEQVDYVDVGVEILVDLVAQASEGLPVRFKR